MHVLPRQADSEKSDLESFAMDARLQRRGWHYLLLLALGGILFVTNLGGASLWDLDEGRNATCALEMMEAGTWIVPTFNAQLRVDKPALLYWLQITAYQLLGVNEFSARLPSALAALLTVLLTYELARSLFGRGTGLLAGVIVASTPMLCGAARFANPDALLNLFTVLTLTLFWRGHDRPRALWFAGVGAAAGFAVLAKGPVGVVLPATVAGLYLLWERRWLLLFDRRWGLAVLALSLIALPWYITVTVYTRADFLRGFVMNHNVNRFLSPMENHRGSPAYYLIVLLVGLAPWSIFLGPALWCGGFSAIRHPWGRLTSAWEWAADRTDETDRTAASYRLLVCWVVVYLVFFTLAATKLPNYVLPVVVPCAVLLARVLERWRLGLLGLPRWVIAVSLTCLLLIGVGLGVGLAIAGGAVALPQLRGMRFPGLDSWAVAGSIPVLAAVLGAWCWRRQQRAGLIVSVIGCAVLLVAPLAAYGSALFDRYKAPRSLVEQAGAWQPDADIRIGCWHLEHLPSINFYVRRDVTHLRDERQILDFLAGSLPVYLFVRADDWQALQARVTTPIRIVGRERDMFRRCEVYVVTNR